MATIHHQPYHHSSSSTRANTVRPRQPSLDSCSTRANSVRPRRHSLDYSSLPSTTTTTTTTSSISFKHPSNTSTITFSTAATTTTPDTAFSLDTLQRHLAAANFRQADEETRRLLIILAGEPAIKRGYVFFSEVQFIPKEDLIAIDELWKKYSNNRFGYSVQKKIWLKVNKDFTRFFLKVGWMKKLDTEIEQYNYRSFPNEFMWELNVNENDNNNNNDNNDIPPYGHLPLTNALRGTQLLNCILSHPAFNDNGEDEEQGSDDKEDGGGQVEEKDNKKSRFASLRDRLFKPNYSF